MSSLPDHILRDWSLSDTVYRPSYVAANNNPSPLTEDDELDGVVDSVGWNRRSASLEEAKGYTLHKLRDHLKLVEQELELKGEEQNKLERLRDEVEERVNELSANLFLEANEMVIAANVKKIEKEQELEQTLHLADELKAQVVALKTMIQSSDESTTCSKLVDTDGSRSVTYSSRGNGIPSHPSPPIRTTPIKKKLSLPRISFRKSKTEAQLYKSSPGGETTTNSTTDTSPPSDTNNRINELTEDVGGLEEFTLWCKNGVILEGEPFIDRLLRDDVRPCLSFSNTQLTEALISEIISNTVTIENSSPSAAGSDYTTTVCALTGLDRDCPYKLKLMPLSVSRPYPICQLTRDKIIAVCDLFTYLSYVKLGLIKNSCYGEIYQRIQILRKNICLLRLGYTL